MPVGHVQTKIREAIEYGLSQITTANGYNCDIRSVSNTPMSPEQHKDFPAINLSLGTEDCMTGQMGRGEDSEGNQARLEMELQLILDCFISEVNDTSLTQENLLADILKYFGNNYYIPDAQGVRTVFNCIYTRSDRWGQVSTTPYLLGLTVEFKIWYRMSLRDPSVLM